MLKEKKNNQVDLADRLPHAQAMENFIPRSNRNSVKENTMLDLQMENFKHEHERKHAERLQDANRTIAESSIQQACGSKLNIVKKDKSTSSLTSPTCSQELILAMSNIETDDEVDGEGELERWKKREEGRIMRDKEATDETHCVHAKAKSLSEWERLQANNATILKAPHKERTKMKFLQKYYHKGAYYQTEEDEIFATCGTDPIYQRDYRTPTAADAFDKTLLPNVMQVKKFGRRGRTKWTHLLKEDSWNFQNSTSHEHVPIMLSDRINKLQSRSQIFEKPSNYRT